MAAMDAGIMRYKSTAGDFHHTFDEEETMAFSEHLNHCLAFDPQLAHLLPIDQTSATELFDKCSDGLLLCKLINLACFDSIDERSINKKPNMNIYHKTENINLSLNAARSIGCQIINIGAQDIIEAKPHLLLGLLWQIIKVQLLSMISLKNFPELVVLLNKEAGETMADFMKLPPEMILLRWLNYQLKRAGSSRVVNNFGSDLADAEVYNAVLHRLNAEVCPLSTDSDPSAKAAKVIKNAQDLGVGVFIKPVDITNGIKKLNMSFVAQIFNTCPGLSVEEEGPQSTIDLSELTKFLEIEDVGDSREERVFRMWINSLNIEDVYLNDFVGDLRNGTNFLRILEKVFPGITEPKRMNMTPKSRFKEVENCNYVVELCKQLKLSVINIGGLDICDGSQKIMLAITWQIMRKYTLLVLAALAAQAGTTEITEDQIVKWANAKVAASGKRSRMRNFKDMNLKNSIFLLDLVTAIEPRAVDWDLVSKVDSEEDYMQNAKYVISNARKVGACVFLTPEDIVEVKSKMILTFVASLWVAELAEKASSTSTAGASLKEGEA